jgi:hypothetical protein
MLAAVDRDIGAGHERRLVTSEGILTLEALGHRAKTITADMIAIARAPTSPSIRRRTLSLQPASN